MTRESVAQRACELAADLPLPAEDWPAVIDQASRILDTVATLDELPLDRVEPASVYLAGPRDGSP
jgi:Protein of unknown function (DUF4089)